MSYLLPSDYEAFGLAAETADHLITVASSMMEAHCRRPSLMAAQYVERVRLTAGGQRAWLSYGPLLPGAITGVRVRYGRPRAGDAPGPAPLLGLEIANAFGLPGTWTALDPATLDVYAATREIGFACNLLGLPYNEAEITYTAGFTTVPDAVKTACAQLVRNMEATPALNVRSNKLDTMQVEYFAPTLIDDAIRALLRPYVAERLG